VKTYFGDIEEGEYDIYRPNVEEPKQTGQIRDTIFDNIQLPAIFKAYHMAEEGTHDYYALNILSNVLSGGKSARLYKQLVDKQQKALQTGSFAYGLEDAGLFILYGISNFGIDIQQIEQGIQKEIEKIKEEGISDQEFQKVKNQIENDFYSSNATMEGIALSLAQYHTLHGDANLINTEIDKYMDVTKEEVQQVAKKYLKDESSVVLYYLPKQQTADNQ
jgi:predicted Zn-dependent peptidase